MQSRTACSEECAIILFCCLFHFTYSSSSSSLSICHWIIARLCMHSRQLFSKSNCPAINPQIVSPNQWERSRALTSQPLALNCYLLSSTTHPPPICIPAKLRDSLDHIHHRPLMHRIPLLLRIPNPMIDIPQKSIRLPQCAYYRGISLGLLLCTLTATTMINLHFFLENIFSILLARGRRVHFPELPKAEPPNFLRMRPWNVSLIRLLWWMSWVFSSADADYYHSPAAHKPQL